MNKMIKYICISLMMCYTLLSCSDKEKNNSFPIIINNSTDLNLSALNNFSCEPYFSSELYTEIDKQNIYIEKNKLNPEGSNNFKYGILTIKNLSEDSLWINIEIYRVMNKTDTLRFSNFGGKNIVNDQNTINLINYYLCKFFNK